MTDSYEIMNSVSEWLNIIEMKKFVDDGDALADEDHTYHLSEQEYFYCKNKWWLHSNKQGSDTMPLRNRSDFKQALSTLERLQQEAGEEPHRAYLLLQAQTMAVGTEFIFLHGGIGKIPGGLLKIQKVKEEASKSLEKWTEATGLLAVFGKLLRKRLSRIQFILLQMDRLQLTAVYCNRRKRKSLQRLLAVSVKTTPQMTRFRGAKSVQ